MLIQTFASSSSGNCTLVSGGGTNILIDAGISMRRIKTALGALGLTPCDLSAILITHEHSDHIGGLKMMTKYFHIPVFAPRRTGGDIAALLPETEAVMTVFDAGDSFDLGSLTVRSFRTMHDTPDSVGYRLDCGGASFVYATDLGCVTNDVLAAARGVDAAVIEANHDVDMLKYGPYPYELKRRILSNHGHLSNEASADFARELLRSGTKSFVLAHLSRENNTPLLAYRTVNSALAALGGEYTLSVAPFDEQGKVIEL
ncbi:MAG: MBL fold metallo-hydrolase [Oscillospiraceae bacterium]|nr:MBL fold metallo-hydrolase [Oscillospiraceae bacterium]